MSSSPTTEKVIPYALLGMTVVTGLWTPSVFCPSARLHCEHDGHVVILAFATAHVSGLSIPRSFTALWFSDRGDTRRTGHPVDTIHRFDLLHSVLPGGRFSFYCVVLPPSESRRFVRIFVS